jgi:hypothetical protein
VVSSTNKTDRHDIAESVQSGVKQHSITRKQSYYKKKNYTWLYIVFEWQILHPFEVFVRSNLIKGFVAALL